MLDEAGKQIICGLLATGCPLDVAADYVRSTERAILEEASRDADFGARLRHAESVHEVSQLGVISAAAREKNNWRAAAWVLERCHPKRYAPRRSSAVTSQDLADVVDRFVQIVIEEVPPGPERERILKRFAQLAAASDQEASAPS
jgi:hypothetical protein